jgi:AbrB family looped-hinge helix DNA binding protein
MEFVDETTVDDGERITIPSSVRESIQIETGDRLRWKIDEDGTVMIEPVTQRQGAFEDFEAFDGDEQTNAVEDKHTVGVE